MAPKRQHLTSTGTDTLIQLLLTSANACDTSEFELQDLPRPLPTRPLTDHVKSVFTPQ
jgi:hypothetical protein